MSTPEKVSRLADVSVLTPWGRARRVNKVDVATKPSDTHVGGLFVKRILRFHEIAKRCCFVREENDNLYRIDKLYTWKFYRTL